MHLFYLTIFLFSLTLIEAATVKRCNLQFRCSWIEQSVSATDGKMCYVFRNGCFLAIENCRRKNKCKADLRVITRDKCKAMCNNACPAIYKPVCCNNENSMKTFSNQCELTRHICESGKTCISTQSGRCSCDL